MRSLLRLACAAGLAAALAARLPAQSGGGMAASESYMLLFSSVSEAGGTPASSSWTSIALVGQTFATGVVSSSANFSFESSALAEADPAGFAGAPILFGVSPDLGGAAGGERARVFGLNLAAGALPTEVWFGDRPASAVIPLSATALELRTPAGASAFGNPLGSLAVRVRTGRGTAERADAYVYGPALLLEAPARVGAPLFLRYRGPEGAVRVLAGAAAGNAQRWAGAAGSLELFGARWVSPWLAAPDGEARISGALPARVQFPGALLQLQALALTPGADSSAAFTNPLLVTVQP